MRIEARVTEDIMPGVVCLLEGVWPSFEPDGTETAGSPNVLTSTVADAAQLQLAYSLCSGSGHASALLNQRRRAVSLADTFQGCVCRQERYRFRAT